MSLIPYSCLQCLQAVQLLPQHLYLEQQLPQCHQQAQQSSNLRLPSRQNSKLIRQLSLQYRQKSRVCFRLRTWQSLLQSLLLQLHPMMWTRQQSRLSLQPSLPRQLLPGRLTSLLLLLLCQQEYHQSSFWQSGAMARETVGGSTWWP